MKGLISLQKHTVTQVNEGGSQIWSIFGNKLLLVWKQNLLGALVVHEGDYPEQGRSPLPRACRFGKGIRGAEVKTGVGLYVSQRTCGGRTKNEIGLMASWGRSLR